MKKALSILTLTTVFALFPPLNVWAEGVSAQHMADILYRLIEAHRTTYSKLIVNRPTIEEEVIEASEHWQDDQALMLPAQMFRATAELVQQQNDLGMSYSLLSLWPINSKNNPRTEVEKKGLRYIVDNPGKHYYGKETLGGQTYFTAVYPDIAVTQACVTCHNEHKDSSKTDFELGQVMGGVVIRLEMDKL